MPFILVPLSPLLTGKDYCNRRVVLSSWATESAASEANLRLLSGVYLLCSEVYAHYDHTTYDQGILRDQGMFHVLSVHVSHFMSSLNSKQTRIFAPRVLSAKIGIAPLGKGTKLQTINFACA